MSLFRSPPLWHVFMSLVLLAVFSGVPVLIVTFVIYNVNKYRSRNGITRLSFK